MKHTQVSAELAYCRLCVFTPGLHWPSVLLTIPKTFDDLVAISVICFAHDNLESDFTPKYA